MRAEESGWTTASRSPGAWRIKTGRIGSDIVETRWKWWNERPRTAAWAERYGGGIEEVERLFQHSSDSLKAAREQDRLRAEAAAAARDREAAAIADRKRIELEAAAARDKARSARRAAVVVSALLVVAVALGALSYWQRAAAMQQKALAENNLQVAISLAIGVQEQVLQLSGTGQISVSTAKQILSNADQAFSQFGEAAELIPSIMYGRFTILKAFADTFAELEDAKQALKLSQQAKAVALKLVTADPTNDRYQALVYDAAFRIGDAEADLSNFEAAMREYQEALSIAERLAQKDPANYIWKQHAAFVMNKIGDIYRIRSQMDNALQSYRSALAISEKLASANQDDQSLQRDLATALTQIGEMQVIRNNLMDALKSV